ncbi:4-(cytidine 5'-diphospho)-2-C-methyl-D-erythritol kinase [Verrucomicrobium sp. BvORR034]|uniref:4-(cytidine 5'-diphospho)-2-C-methyl-D-erythritol kinase n=1 Tax=Verrucomicrobium sp. BvORR034 TaxID=1396418 RepID=UPI0006796A5E|nr:4-(cytidine 5'-diphospho)-2-C-methyl-D-erythritol kinase [Verrucomicrobium sp. BvORR034]
MSSPVLQLSCPAKINLHLRVLGKREDGFHALDTRLCPLDLSDTLSFSEASATPRISQLTCSDASLPTDETNLVMKALRAFEKATGTPQSWNLHLEKRIPHGAGLGGGSSNAAMTLRGLNLLSGHPLSQETLVTLGSQLGSDVPFFLYDAVCDATGRGEVLTPLDFPWQLPVVLIKPPFGIPTPWAYKQWSTSTQLHGVLYAPQLCPWGPMVNDLERPVFEKWSLLPALKMWLLDQVETRAALMSGSGSTVFAVAQSETDAAALATKAAAHCGETTWVKVVRAGHP